MNQLAGQQLFDLDTQEAWSMYQDAGVGPATDGTLITMMQELIHTIKSIQRIYGHEQSQLLVRTMLLDYQALSSMARARRLQDFPGL